VKSLPNIDIEADYIHFQQQLRVILRILDSLNFNDMHCSFSHQLSPLHNLDFRLLFILRRLSTIYFQV